VCWASPFGSRHRDEPHKQKRRGATPPFPLNRALRPSPLHAGADNEGLVLGVVVEVAQVSSVVEVHVALMRLAIQVFGVGAQARRNRPGDACSGRVVITLRDADRRIGTLVLVIVVRPCNGGEK
jgi:hypothetical protein